MRASFNKASYIVRPFSFVAAIHFELLDAPNKIFFSEVSKSFRQVERSSKLKK
jgi:hypothetical protein